MLRFDVVVWVEGNDRLDGLSRVVRELERLGLPWELVVRSELELVREPFPPEIEKIR